MSVLKKFCSMLGQRYPFILTRKELVFILDFVMLRLFLFLLLLRLSYQFFHKPNLKALLIKDRVNAKGMFKTTSVQYSQNLFYTRDLTFRRKEISSPVVRFISDYFAENPGLNATESLYEVFDWMYKKCDPEINSDPEISPDRLKCQQLYSELYFDVIDEFSEWLVTNNTEYTLQIEYLQFKLLNWGTKIEPKLFKDDFCNLSEKEDLEELNYQLIQVVCSIIKKNDTEFVKKLPLLIPEDDETRIYWLRKADEAVQRMHEYFENQFDIEEIKKTWSDDKSSIKKQCLDEVIDSVKSNY